MKAKSGQIYSLKQTLEDIGIDTGDEGVYVINEFLDLGINDLDELPKFAWESFRDIAYPDWRNDNWELDEDVRNQLSELKYEYREDIMGQETLF